LVTRSVVPAATLTVPVMAIRSDVPVLVTSTAMGSMTSLLAQMVPTPMAMVMQGRAMWSLVRWGLAQVVY
jgi:hypothetical protein